MKNQCPEEDCPYILDDGNCSFVECLLEEEQRLNKTRKKRKKDNDRASDFYY